jgi:DHA3 family tetracycline resistance protein-like MFS transporter
MRGSQAEQIGGMVGIAVSVALGSITLALPVVAGGLSLIALTALLVVVMPENGFRPLPRDERGASWASMARTVRTTVKLVRLRPMLVTFLAVGLVLGLYSEGYDRLWRAHLLDDIGLPALGTLPPVVWFGIISGVSMLLVTVMTEVIRRRVDTRNQRVVSRTLVMLYGVIVGILWQSCLTALPIYLVLLQWSWVAALALVLSVTSVFLKFNWYDKLEKA